MTQNVTLVLLPNCNTLIYLLLTTVMNPKIIYLRSVSHTDLSPAASQKKKPDSRLRAGHTLFTQEKTMTPGAMPPGDQF